MAEESDIRIIAWPEDALPMRHRFEPDEPCPVRVSFEDTPVNVQVETGERPLAVDMRMDVRAREPVPLCISICEPICAKSDYTISFDIFDQPVGRILVRGMTRIFNCRDEPTQQPEETCVDFQRRKDNETFPDQLVVGGATFRPVEGELRIITWGQPAGRNKLLFTSAGVEITLPEPSDRVVVTLVNHFGQSLNLSVLRDGTEIENRVETVGTTPVEVEVTQSGVTGLVVSGGGNEATVVRLCWTPEG